MWFWGLLYVMFCINMYFMCGIYRIEENFLLGLFIGYKEESYGWVVRYYLDLVILWDKIILNYKESIRMYEVY